MNDDPEEGSRLAGELKLHSAKGGCLGHALDSASYEDASSLIQYLESVSTEFGLEIEIDLNGELIGSISDGQRDRSLAVGLLGEWKRRVMKMADVE